MSETIKCKNCGRECINNKGGRNKMFCSKACTKQYKKEYNFPFRLMENTKRRIRSVIKSNGIEVESYAKYYKMIQASTEKLYNHIMDLAEEGMASYNYGEWHIDHRAPCSFFDLTNDKEAAICFHYLNLQPMWKKENMSKHNKVDLSHLKNRDSYSK